MLNAIKVHNLKVNIINSKLRTEINVASDIFMLISTSSNTFIEETVITVFSRIDDRIAKAVVSYLTTAFLKLFNII